MCGLLGTGSSLHHCWLDCFPLLGCLGFLAYLGKRDTRLGLGVQLLLGDSQFPASWCDSAGYQRPSAPTVSEQRAVTGPSLIKHSLTSLNFGLLHHGTDTDFNLWGPRFIVRYASRCFHGHTLLCICSMWGCLYTVFYYWKAFHLHWKNIIKTRVEYLYLNSTLGLTFGAQFLGSWWMMRFWEGQDPFYVYTNYLPKGQPHLKELI